MRTLLIGATGFLGRRVVRYLDSLGHHIHVVARSPYQFNGKNVSSEILDLNDPGRVYDFPFEDYESIIHMATVFPSSSMERRGLFTVNTSSILSIIDRLTDKYNPYSTRLLFFSAMSMFRGSTESVITSKSDPCPTTSYDISKRAAEVCLSDYPYALVFRIPLILEAGASRSWLTQAFADIRQHKDIIVSNPGSLYNHIIDSESIFQAISLFLEPSSELVSSYRGALNFGSINPMTILDIVDILKSMSGSHSMVVTRSSAQLPCPPVISTTDILRFGIRLKTVEATVRQYVRASLKP